MSSTRRSTRQRKPLGHLTTEQLLVHRELELLRVAGRRPPRGRSGRRRHAQLLGIRFAKLAHAQLLTARPPG